MSIQYDSTPVIGYRDGLIKVTSNELPARITVGTNSNDWFYIGLRRYNVHPFRSDLGGYPVRWIEIVNPNDVNPLP